MYQKNKPSAPRSGFTLVEILVIAPIVILAISVFVTLIITITGDVLRTKGTSDLIYNTQDTLDRIEQDAVRTVEFRATSYTPLSPNGMTGTTNFDGAAAFTIDGSSPARLIMRSLTTDSQPLSDTRQLVYKNTPNCTVSTTPYMADIVYFIRDSSLWRRVLIGDSTLTGANTAGSPCMSPWQVATCSLGWSSSVCKADDSELVTNVSAVTIEYFNDAGALIPSGPSLDAVAARITLQTTDVVAGRTNVNTSALYVRRSNSPIVE
jgi:hypothetical protein